MIKHLLYIACQRQITVVENLIKKLNAQQEFNKKAKCYRLSHPFSNQVDLVLHFFVCVKEAASYLKERPIDIIMYDERGDAQEAIKAIKYLESFIECEAQRATRYFGFSMKRVVVVLDQNKNNFERTFKLGRLQVRDIIISPDNSFKLLRWVSKLLVFPVKQNGQKIGVALSGAGLEGYLYQLGCLHALDKVFVSRKIFDQAIYSGVSSGSIMASLLAHKVPLLEVIKSLLGKSTSFPSLTSSVIYDFAVKDLFQRVMKKGFFYKSKDDLNISKKFLSAVPNGICKGRAMYSYLESILKKYNPTLSFGSLDSKLFIGATHQNSLEHITFGLNPWRDISIVDAVRASCALIPIFTPWNINGEVFIDGQISQACNIDVLVKNGCDLIIIVDPLIPWTSIKASSKEEDQGGIFATIQTIKTLVHTRFTTQINHLSERYPDIDFVLFQPSDECSYVMRGSPMKFKLNTDIIHLSYRQTLHAISKKFNIYCEKFAKYDLSMIGQSDINSLQLKGLEVV